jgi:hypothetical protein
MGLEGCFQLKSADHVIAARFTGCWSMTTELDFMNRFCSEIKKVQTRGAWVLFVDMREWEMRDEVIAKTQKIKHDLDRRNQKGECWLIENDHQGHFLLPLFATLPFDLHRYKQSTMVLDWFAGTHLDTPDAVALVKGMMLLS